MNVDHTRVEIGTQNLTNYYNVQLYIYLKTISTYF